MIEYKDSNNKEWLVYVSESDNSSRTIYLNNLSDTDFIEEAESYGDVYTLKGFQHAFNEENLINSRSNVIRILYV